MRSQVPGVLLECYRGTSLTRNSLPPPGRPQGPMHIATVGSQGGAVSYERGTPVASMKCYGRFYGRHGNGTLTVVRHGRPSTDTGLKARSPLSISKSRCAAGGSAPNVSMPRTAGVHARPFVGVSRIRLENFWRICPIRFLRTDSRNNFESWQKDVVSHFLSDIGKDHSERAQSENGSKNVLTAPRTSTGYPHEGPFVDGMARALRWSWGGARLLRSEVPLHSTCPPPRSYSHSCSWCIHGGRVVINYLLILYQPPARP